MSDDKKKIFIIAGEASGDAHASELVKNILKLNNEISFSGIGGDNLINCGVELIHNYNEINHVGFISVLKNIFSIRKIFNSTLKNINQINPDIIILVDFPGFNLRLAKYLRKSFKGKIIYYISPQIWAWHKSRIETIRKTIDKMLVIFPFEVEFYSKANIEALFVGHPLKNRITGFLENNSKAKNEKFQITLLPGSRVEEVKYIFPGLIETALKLKEQFDAEINVICAQNIDTELLKSLSSFKNYKIFKNKSNIDDTGYTVILNSDVIFAKTGTATLECCLLGTPIAVVYRTNFLNYVFGKLLIKVDYISIINILAGKEIVKEFVQNDFNITNLFNEGKRILIDEKYKSKMISHFEEIRKALFDSEVTNDASVIINDMIK